MPSQQTPRPYSAAPPLTKWGEKGGLTRKRKRMEYRDPSEWIAIKVPAIVSQQLFDQVQARLQLAASRYRKVPIRPC
jgi:hypothetical protein